MSAGLRLPAYPVAGEAARQEWGAAVVDQLRRQSGKGVTLPPGRALRALVTEALTPHDRSTVADGWRVGITSGRVYSANNAFAPLVPTLGGVALDHATPPAATVSAAVTHLYLHVVTDDFTENLVAPITFDLVDAEDDAPEDDFENGYLLVATLTKVGTEAAPGLTISAPLTGHRSHRKVNLTHLWGRV